MKVLIVEDSATLCAIYEAYLEGAGFDVFTSPTLSEARQALCEEQPELLLIDIELPDGNGLELIGDAKSLRPAPAVVVMTSHGPEFSEQAIARGADDFLAKPFDAPRLRVTLTNAAEKASLSQRVRSLASHQRDHSGGLWGESSVMQVVYDAIDALAGSRATALIMGESGTGKALVARAIHSRSARAPGPFVVLNGAMIPDETIELVLFGRAENTGELSEEYPGILRQADGGTLLIDEVCDLSFDLQSTLLRFLEDGTFSPVGSGRSITSDVRIIASTNRDPLFEMREGRLREDLFYRLYVVPLRLPPLRERELDSILLAKRFLTEFSLREGKVGLFLDDEANAELRRYIWPGNVRQLENLVLRLVVMSQSEQITAGAVRSAIRDSDALSFEGLESDLEASAGYSELPRQGIEPLWVTEKRAIQSAIDLCDGNINRASGMLEVAPSTIYRKIQAWKSSRPS